jgi:hypothetical protein
MPAPGQQFQSGLQMRLFEGNEKIGHYTLATIPTPEFLTSLSQQARDSTACFIISLFLA